MSLKCFFRKYSFFLPPLFVLVTNLTSSFVTRLFISGDTYNLITDWDKAIPFVPEFIHIYFLAFVQWAVCLVSVMIVDRKTSLKYCTAMSVANLLCGVVFFVVPTVMTIRPEFSGGGAFTELVGKFLFAADTPPKNILPSVHCLHSWGCMRMIFAVKKAPGWLKAVNAIFSFLVFASVLFVKQHLIIDIPAGILIFEVGFLITVMIEKIKQGDKKNA